MSSNRSSSAADPRPVGRVAVMQALVDATTKLIVEQGMSMSVREIAARAGVNHGLVHTYFGSKHGLLTAALDAINSRAAEERDPRGYPPPDLAGRREGELAKALARVMLESPSDPFSSHPVTSSWRAALERDHPDSSPDDLDEQVMVASSLALGWALFADYFSNVFAVDAERRVELDEAIAAHVAELGAIPPTRLM